MEYSKCARRSSFLAVKGCIKSYVAEERKEKKTVKWADEVEIFEEKFENYEQQQLVWNYRKSSMTKQIKTVKDGETSNNDDDCIGESEDGDLENILFTLSDEEEAQDIDDRNDDDHTPISTISTK